MGEALGIPATERGAPSVSLMSGSTWDGLVSRVTREDVAVSIAIVAPLTV